MFFFHISRNVFFIVNNSRWITLYSLYFSLYKYRETLFFFLTQIRSLFLTDDNHYLTFVNAVPTFLLQIFYNQYVSRMISVHFIFTCLVLTNDSGKNCRKKVFVNVCHIISKSYFNRIIFMRFSHPPSHIENIIVFLLFEYNV